MHTEVALVGFVEITRRYLVVRVGGHLAGLTLRGYVLDSSSPHR